MIRMRPSDVLMALAVGLVLCGCSDGGGSADAEVEQICIPGRLRCDPAETQMLQQCDLDGLGWSDFIQCDLCHDAQCYGRLDASSD